MSANYTGSKIDSLSESCRLRKHSRNSDYAGFMSLIGVIKNMLMWNVPVDSWSQTVLLNN